MKKITTIIIFCFGLFGTLTAQNIWKPINIQGSFMGVSSDGSIFTYFGEYGGYSGISRSQDEGETWQIVLSSETEPNLRFISNGWTISEEGRIYVLAEHYEGEEWDGTYYLFYSDNNGNSWQQHSVLDGLSEFGGITASTNDIIVYWSEGGWGMGGDYMWTVDGGVNWHHTFFAPPHDNVPGHLPHQLTHVIVNASGDLFASYLCYCQSPAAIACAHISNTTSSWDGGLLLDGKVVRDMGFDSEGNALICYSSNSSSVEYFKEQADNYFVFSAPCLAVSDNDVVYTMRCIDDTHVVLNYSQHYGEQFFDVGETLTVNSSAGLFLYKGRDNQLYFQGQGTHFWKSIPNANDIPSLNNWLGGCFFDDDSGLKYIITDPVDHTVEVTWHADPYHGGVYRIPSTVSYKGTTYTVTGIGNQAFSGDSYLSDVTFVDIPETVTYIDDKAFYHCTTLNSINIPNSVVSIGTSAFADCVGLESIHLPESLEVIESALFSNCDLLKSINLPETVSIIKKEAFADCNSLSEIIIPQNVETIGTNAFRWCYNLSRVELGISVSLIGDHAFWNYWPGDKLTVICHNPIPAQCSATTFSNAEYQEKVIVPCGCEEAYRSAWAECWSSGNFEEDCGTIGETFYDETSGLYYNIISDTTVQVTYEEIGETTHPKTYESEVIIPETIDYKGVRYTVTVVGNKAFANCTGLISVAIPESVTTIGDSTFIGCCNLRLTLICRNTNPAECSSTSFPDVEYQEKVITPCGFEDVYREAWGEYWQSGNFEKDCFFETSEWYYEILNDDGSITYQYLQHVSDTVIQDEPVHIIVKINKFYNKEHVEKSYEYICERNNKVFWWNKTLGEFTLLYDFGSEIGDEWEIKVGTESLLMHVDDVWNNDYNGCQLKYLQVSDADNLFGGTIVCGIGHLTSFFPEQLMQKDQDYRVNGIRCFWRNGELVFKYGDRDCDAIYGEYHYGLEEPAVTAGFSVYPNPNNGIITVSGCQSSDYRITNVLGQTLLTGQIATENQQIKVSALPNGLYFIRLGETTFKLIKE